MQIYFLEKEMEKNIEFTKELFDMDLEGKVKYFDKKINVWKRGLNEKMTLDKFIEFIPKINFFHTRLQIGEDPHIGIRYAMNLKDSKRDEFLEIQCDLTGENFCKVNDLYKSIYNQYLQEVKN